VSVISVARSVLGYALNIAATPGGSALVQGLGGPVASLILNFGIKPLAAVLNAVDTPEITEEQIEAQLAKGVKVEKLDTSLKALYGWDEPAGAPV